MEDIKKKLKEIGFADYEAKAYSVLLNQGILTASELSKLGKIPQARIYDIMDTLEQKGFCITILGKVKKFKAVNPQTALNGFIEERKKALQEDERKIKSLADELEKDYKDIEDRSSPLDCVQILTSKASQIKKFNELGNCKKLCRTFNKAPYITKFDRSSPLKTSKPLIDAIKNGAEIRAIWEVDEENIDGLLYRLTYWEEWGEKVRVIDKLPLKLIISDDTAVMFTLLNKGVEGSDLTSMAVEHSQLTTALSELHEFYWNKSMTLDEFIESRGLKRPVIDK